MERTAWSSACLACGVAVPSGLRVSSRTVTSFSSKPSNNAVGNTLDAILMVRGGADEDWRKHCQWSSACRIGIRETCPWSSWTFKFPTAYLLKPISIGLWIQRCFKYGRKKLASHLEVKYLSRNKVKSLICWESCGITNSTFQTSSKWIMANVFFLDQAVIISF